MSRVVPAVVHDTLILPAAYSEDFVKRASNSPFMQCSRRGAAQRPPKTGVGLAGARRVAGQEVRSQPRVAVNLEDGCTIWYCALPLRVSDFSNSI